MFELRCKTCGTLIGETSIAAENTHECSQCYEEREFEASLRAGLNFTTRELAAVKVKEIVNKVADEAPEIFANTGFEEKVETIAKKHPKVVAIRDEQMRTGLQAAADAELTKERSPTGTTVFI